MRDLMYGAFIALIAWAIIGQWKRNKDNVKTLLWTLVIGAIFVILMLMIWKKATIGRFY